MKAPGLKLFVKNLFVKKVVFLSSAVVPAARGYVKVKKDLNENYCIRLRISNLAEVNRLQPSKKVYLVWMVNDLEVTECIGQLKSATTFLSTKLKASFNKASSAKPIKLFITAENDAGTKIPDSQVILTTDRFLLD
ncbi:MAG: hypothetical protein NTW10_00240 [Bacteroidetes bacterium]|nr:hypothetical protein [Bacteroidota bacterium]